MMATNFTFNVLAAAQTVIRTREITLERFSGRSTNAIGNWISTYETPITVKCSVQPVSRSMYEKMGLNFEKTYISILATPEIEDLGRDRSGDRVTFNGDIYETNGETEWQAPAGWNRVICVKVDDV